MAEKHGLHLRPVGRKPVIAQWDAREALFDAFVELLITFEVAKTQAALGIDPAEGA